MPAGADTAPALTFQARFERRWGHLVCPPVRALAWLLDSPDLLDAAAPYWTGRIASLGPVGAATASWLAALDADPAPLDAALGGKVYSRLGLYAEKLMAFYFAQHGQLVEHGLQVRVAHKGGKDTVGEFDFLLQAPAGLRHIEFATKFYLIDSAVDTTDFDLLVGPNLGDTLGRKMRKIFDQQLALAQHPAAQAVLPQPVTSAQALVKGWLYYPPGRDPVVPGLTPDHCRGRWHTLADMAGQAGESDEQFVVMPRLQWLAPLKVPAARGPDDALPPTPPALSRAELAALLAQKFAADQSPVMVAAVREEGGWLLEEARAFIVPDDWPVRAALRRGLGEPRA